MSEYIETVSTEDANAVIDSKLRKVFDGRIVRKDLTKKIKEGANVPVYVLEFLLGQYCSSDDEDVIETGVANVKRILAENYVRPDEAQKILSVLRQRGSYKRVVHHAKRFDRGRNERCCGHLLRKSLLLPLSNVYQLGTDGRG